MSCVTSFLMSDSTRKWRGRHAEPVVTGAAVVLATLTLRLRSAEAAVGGLKPLAGNGGKNG